MIVVKVELHSAITGRVSRIGTVRIANVGGSKTRGDYQCESFRAGELWPDKRHRFRLRPAAVRSGEVKGHARKREPVLSLVRKALESMNY